MPSVDSLPCRHPVTASQVDATRRLLKRLDAIAPSLLQQHGVEPQLYQALLRGAIESLRGSNAASDAQKRAFVEGILSFLKQQSFVADYRYVGTQGRMDFQVELPNGRRVALELKGCPDGNNTTIWSRPQWADELVIWFQCPLSFRHQPGANIWKGFNRLLRNIKQGHRVDAVVYYDVMCGSPFRPCPKGYGSAVPTLARAAETFRGQPSPMWPPPSVFLWPRQLPDPQSNPHPPLHDLSTCTFPASLLEGFGVPQARHPDEVFWVEIELRTTMSGYTPQNECRLKVGRGISQAATVLHQGDWREY